LRAVLVIAKLDRLARNVYFVSNLMESRVEFIATDMPSATKLTIHLLAAIAEHESDMISVRTKDALREAKRKGKVLGNPALHLVREKGLRSSLERANSFAARMKAPLVAVLNKGIQSYPRIATELNEQGFATRRGCYWTSQAVKNLMTRLNLGAIESCTEIAPD
jgi:DNA invertase Pin-like site-specific DNA recombinase